MNTEKLGKFREHDERKFHHLISPLLTIHTL
jgi:hypothetical protein